jgi:DNA-binding response OmpR family regulator
MNIQFLSNLLVTKPQVPEKMPVESHAPRPIIIKLDARPHRLDGVAQTLIDGGFQVIRARSPQDALKFAHRLHPDLILVIDNPRAGIDGKAWLALQHSDVSADNAAMCPLLILLDKRRADILRGHELPGRVKLLVKPQEDAQLLDVVHQFLRISDF